MCHECWCNIILCCHNLDTGTIPQAKTGGDGVQHGKDTVGEGEVNIYHILTLFREQNYPCHWKTAIQTKEEAMGKRKTPENCTAHHFLSSHSQFSTMDHKIHCSQPLQPTIAHQLLYISPYQGAYTIT